MPGKRPKPDFIVFLEESLAPLGGVETKPMFGGFGIFKDGLMFGLVADDLLYLKVDAENKPRFETLGLGPFTYARDGKHYSMSYHRAPATALEQPGELVKWAISSHAAALRAKK